MVNKHKCNEWIYIFGAISAADIKIGKTSTETVAKRLNEVNREQTTNEKYILLAAVLGSAKDEAFLHKYFAEFLSTDKGSKREYYHPVPEIVEYAAWMRGQWWAATTGHELKSEHVIPDASHWHPADGRRYKQPLVETDKLFGDSIGVQGALPGSWSWFPNPNTSIQDYFTPPIIMSAAREAMGSIDLDAASHWVANRVHKIPDYFDSNRSAMTNDWNGSGVWVNPPFGNNEPWFQRTLHFLDMGAIQQVCFLSPVWAFTTTISLEFMTRASGMVLLSPTPKFWRDESKLAKGITEDKCGSNHPHAIVYIGRRKEHFFRAFTELGIPMQLIKVKPI